MIAAMLAGLLLTATPEVPEPERYEVMGFPALSFSTDTGFHFGVLGLVARFEPGYSPYKYRIEAKTEASVREGPNGDAEFPSHDHFLVVDLPEVFPRVRLIIEGAYRRDITLYHGLGNASPGLDRGASPRTRQYTRSYPTLALMARIRGPGRVFFGAGLSAEYSQTTVHPGSALAAERDGRAHAVAVRNLHGVEDHVLVRAHLSAEYDSRDHEIATKRGMHFYVRGTSAATATLRDPYGALDIGARGYVPLYRDSLTLGLRLDGALTVGDAPFFALPTLGGERILRGIPEGRYTGRLRLLGSVELRTFFTTLSLAGHQLKLGAVFFLDSGRVFSDLVNHSALDGDDVNIHWGAGGGLRLLWGESILVRIDLGASPRSIGGYVGIGPTF